MAIPRFQGTKTSPCAKGSPRPPKHFRNTAVAAAFHGSLDAAAFPPSKAWRTAKPVLFDTDWQGTNPDPHRQTEVRLLWTPEFLYLKFVARYRLITVFDDADSNGRRDKLWDRDVAEVFLQPDPATTAPLQRIRGKPQWLLDRSGNRKRRASTLKKRPATPRKYRQTQKNMDRRIGHPHEKPHANISTPPPSGASISSAWKDQPSHAFILPGSPPTLLNQTSTSPTASAS